MVLSGPRAEVFVIGGGPAGLAAAIAARRRGFDVTLADASIPPVDKACGEGIMPDGLTAAEKLGIRLDASEGFLFRGIRFCEGAVATEAAFPNGHGLGLRRTLLHRALVQQAESLGVHLAWGTRVTDIRENIVTVEGRPIRAEWIIGADGGESRVRRWAGLEACARLSTRFGFRRHYRISPWSPYMELHWGRRGQIYVTPVAREELCVVVLSRDPHFRLEEGLREFPEIASRLASAPRTNTDRGAASITRRLRAVHRGRVALVGDASGSVDAITGEGLCLVFQQCAALADALSAGDLRGYAEQHRRMRRQPALMADLMLILENRHRLRSRALRAFAGKPQLFANLLASHVGAFSAAELLRNAAALGWGLVCA